MVETQEIHSIAVASLQVHPVAEATPLMKPEQYVALKQSIELEGQKLPGIVYRGRIVDGRHRLRALTELGEEYMKVTKLANNMTTQELETLVSTVEVGRHQTPSQLAIYAYKEYSLGVYSTLAEAAKAKGSSTKQVSRAKQLAEKLGRLDIIDIIHNGGQINVGNAYKPLLTDSLASIISFVTNERDEHIVIEGLEKRRELTEDEELMLGRLLSRITDESKVLQAELVDRLYAITKGTE